MGFFNRRRRRQDEPADEPADETLSELTVGQARRLRELVRTTMAGAGYEVIVYAGYVEDADGRQFGLGTLARRLADPKLSAKRWPGVVDDHLRRILATVDGPDAFDVPTEDVLDRTYLRLYDAAALPEAGWWDYGREVAPGLLELLALDLPDSVATFNDEQVAKHGLDQLRAAGRRNLRQVLAEDRVTHDGVEILAGSMYFASTALVLPDVVLRTTGEARLPNGVLVAMPFRHQLMYHVLRDQSVIEAMNTMVALAVHGYENEVGPISPHVYWWHDGEFQQLTHHEDGRIAVRVDGAFAEVFTRLFPES